MGVECPCCRQSVAVPTLEAVLAAYNVPPFQARLLEAVWRGKGRPVQSSRLIDAIYADDPDGGPSDVLAAKNLKVALCRLRSRLKGSGILIETVGYRQGFRLVLSETKAA